MRSLLFTQQQQQLPSICWAHERVVLNWLCLWWLYAYPGAYLVYLFDIFESYHLGQLTRRHQRRLSWFPADV
jgi:hypothetical protein